MMSPEKFHGGKKKQIQMVVERSSQPVYNWTTFIVRNSHKNDSHDPRLALVKQQATQLITSNQEVRVKNLRLTYDLQSRVRRVGGGRTSCRGGTSEKEWYYDDSERK
jgi:hypothetical protein